MSDGPQTRIIARVGRRDDDRERIGTLFVLEGPDTGAFFALKSRLFVIGREEDCDGSFPHASVSRRHASLEILHRKDRLRAQLCDLGSTNGVRVNGRLAKEHWLASGDKLRLGRVLLRFEWMTVEEVAYQRRLADDHRVALQDPLSGLFTRAFLDDRLPNMLKEADEESDPISCILLDLDHFKSINDAHGHLVGDRVIERVARLGRKSLRRSDVGIRYGGEEMLFVLPGADLERALATAEELRKAVAEDPYEDVDGTVNVSASLGVSERLAGESATDWIGRTDEALFDAKRGGRNRVVQAAPSREGISSLGLSEDLAKETIQDMKVVSVDDPDDLLGELYQSDGVDPV
jgi:diguanylate cyclase (GGDEF)-like protein